MDNRAIGIFDSGVGGLTVAKQIMEVMPHEKLIYFGDCLRVPYGDKSPDDLIKFFREITDFLLNRDIKALVVACGTISATVYDVVKQMVDVPIIGMLNPAVDAALAATKTGRIGVVATAATIAAAAHEKAIVARRPDAVVKAVACPLFAPMVEEGWLNNDVARLTAKTYLQDFDGQDIDTLILGCTHYPLLANSIKSALSANVVITDPAIRLVKDLANIIPRADAPSPQHEFYISGYKEKFDKISVLALGKSYNARIVSLTKDV